ncbi:MAG TPA: L,D-transpeptidase [Xanthobacteraceae bacterium]|nr:L,D-transpeptidase [Xanthobacteraceae bacterium]
MFVRWIAAAVALAFCLPQAARAELLVEIDKSAQRLTVSIDGEQKHTWPVSTGRAGYGTPNGRFRPQWMARHWFSRKYYNSPMPHSIFFHKGYAIHGTNYIRRLGGPASHGCVRLHPANAAALFALVKRHGMGNTRIVVTGENPASIAKKKRPRVERARAIEQRFYDLPPRRERLYLPPSYEPRYTPYHHYVPYGRY